MSKPKRQTLKFKSNDISIMDRPAQEFARTEIVSSSQDLIRSKSSKDLANDLKIIRVWLFQIGEPEEDHHLVIDKCKTDPEALSYFLHYARESLFKAICYNT
ncbi:hypothetical protein SAMN05421863_100484 [Nitrosomonas communis]|jgi:hypothetical protein|uniref:Uncharacterized protein n=2 Tax=Nitrosomonas communis TaxID=44574 RepID=A0A1I4KIV8_9PROT|nr:hypothetical protein SAMN05421863_100484 [Nitrosomonas communis]